MTVFRDTCFGTDPQHIDTEHGFEYLQYKKSFSKYQQSKDLQSFISFERLLHGTDQTKVLGVGAKI